MFGRGKKNKGVSNSFKGLKFIGKNRKSKKTDSNIDQHTEEYLKSIDSDYDDSHNHDIDVVDDASNQVMAYKENNDERTKENYAGGVVSTFSSTSVPSSPTMQEPAVVESTPAKLTAEERKARARKAVDERKKKAQMQIAARKAKASGAAPIAVAVTPEKEAEVPMVEKESNEGRRRPMSEERERLLEQERQREQEEREMLEKEEAEMKALEEALKKEEEEAKKLAEQDRLLEQERQREQEEREMLEKEEAEMKALEEALRKEEEEAKKLAEQDRLVEQERQREQGEREMLEKEEAEMKALEEALKKEEEEAKKLAEQYMVEVETVDSDDLKEDETNPIEEAEQSRAAELASFEAEVAGTAEKSEKNAQDLLNQFVDIGDESIDFVNDASDSANSCDSAQLPDLDDLLGSSTILDEAIGGPIKFTPPASKPNKRKKVASKPKAPSRFSWKPKPKPKTNARNQSTTNTAIKNSKKKTPMMRPLKPKPKPKPPKKIVKVPFVANKSVKKPPVTRAQKQRPKPPTIKSKPLPKPKPKPKLLGLSVPPIIFRASRNGSSAASPTLSGICSVGSMGSQCTFNSLPLSPYTKVTSNVPTCSNKYIPDLHAKTSGCQVCIFKLSPAEKEQYEKNGRHLRVAMTTGGCKGCTIFPSAEGEEHVRISRKCFFDTHLLHTHKRGAFDGNGNLMGVQKYTPPRPVRHRNIGARSGASVS